MGQIVPMTISNQEKLMASDTTWQLVCQLTKM